MFLAFSPFRASNAPRRPKRPPRPRQDRPRAPQDGPKTGQEGPRTAQEAPRTAPDRPGTGPRWAQEREQEAPRGLGEASRTSQRLPRNPRPLRGPKKGPTRPRKQSRRGLKIFPAFGAPGNLPRGTNSPSRNPRTLPKVRQKDPETHPNIPWLASRGFLPHRPSWQFEKKRSNFQKFLFFQSRAGHPSPYSSTTSH